MSSIYSHSPEDDFFSALNKSLRNEYSSQKMTGFITDLLVAINNINPDEGFRFFDEDTDSLQANGNQTDFWNDFDCFASTSSNDYSEPHQHNYRLDKFEKSEAHNTSVDMFADDQPSILLSRVNDTSDEEVNSTIVDTIPETIVESDHDVAPHSLPVADILEEESCDSSVDMFAEFENDVEVMDTDSVHSDDVHSSVVDHPNEVADDSRRVTQTNWNINQQNGGRSFENKSKTINEMVDVDQPADTEVPKSFSFHHDHQGLLPNEHPDTENIELSEDAEHENVETLAGHSVSILHGVPMNISHSETSPNENTSGSELRPNEMPNRMVGESPSVFAILPETVSTTSNSSQDGGHRIPRQDNDEIAETSMRSFCHSSVFRGFSPVPPLFFQQPLCDSTKLDSDLNTTLCEEYEFLNNFVPVSRQSSRGSPIFHGFSDAVELVSQTSERHNSIRSVPGSEGGPDSTFCEEYESERLFAMYLNATQSDPIDLEEAYTQCFTESQHQVSGPIDRRQSLIEEIEKLVLKIQNDLVNGSKLTLAVPYRVAWKNCIVNDERLLLRPLSDGGTRIIGSKRSIALIVYVLSFVYKLLINGETCTRREIYYSDPEFTHSQIQVDTAIMDICLILNAPPWDIGILSSSKGLIAGSIKLTLKDDTVLDVESVDGGILLPQQTVSIKKVETSARFVLLVEKHTVYEKCLLENVLNRLGPCILITGKGYPDINTRSILKKIWDDCKCPIYALVDADPFGIEIMLSYRHGTQKMSLFNDNLAIPSIRWIGVFPSEINKFNLQSLPMTQRDTNRLESLMKRPYLNTKIYAELLVLKKSQKKVEVEALLSSAVVGCINSHLSQKIEAGEFI